jgi:hypothetical protein
MGLRKSIIVAFFLGSTTAFGQQAPKPSENLSALEFLLGDWIITVDARLSKNGPWERSIARSTFKKAVGDTIIEEELTGARQNGEWVARCLIAVDNRTLRYQWAFADSDHGVLELYEGDMTNDTLTLQKEIVFPQSKVLRRIIYSNLSINSFKVQSMRSVDNGKTWDLTGTSHYERVKR